MMTDRYGRYQTRQRSPPLFNPARASLPINIGGSSSHEVHLQPIPSARRDVVSTAVSNSGTITTTYKIKAEVPRSSSTRETSRNRRSTLESLKRPVATASRHKPLVRTVSNTEIRPESPPNNTRRKSDEDYITIPAISRHGYQPHRKRNSVHVDSADVRNLNDQDGGKFRTPNSRESAYTTRSRPTYTTTNAARHQGAVPDAYQDDGYGYTKPGELLQYDLDHGREPAHRPRRDSFDTGRNTRPNGTSNYEDPMIPRTYEPRERGPPPSTRGFSKIKSETWEPSQQARLSAASAPIPGSVPESMQRTTSFDAAGLPTKRGNSRVRNSTYHDRELRSGTREEIFEVRDDYRRERQPREVFDDAVEQRGFGLRIERVDQPDRIEKADRFERSEPDHRDTKEPKDHLGPKEYRGRDAVTGSMSIAGAALGINVVKNVSRDDRKDREEREDRRRQEDKEEPRRRRDLIDPDATRDEKERRSQDDASPSRITPRLKSPHRGREEREIRDRDPSREWRASRDERAIELERRPHRKLRPERNAYTPSDSSSSADEAAPKSRRDRSGRDRNATNTASFNSKDIMGLKALKEELNMKNSAPKVTSKDSSPRISRESARRDDHDAERSGNLSSNFGGSRSSSEHKPRVVSPPRDKTDDKPVKGILRQPRERFPEDPVPVREGVAPLKDAKKDGIPPDARWTKISRRLVNPEALEAGKERFEARDDFVIVLRVLSKDEVQDYAEVTQKIRASRDELNDMKASEQRRVARRSRHQRHKRERAGEARERRRAYHHEQESESTSECSDTEEDEGGDKVIDNPIIDSASRRRGATFHDMMMSGGLGDPNSSRAAAW